MENNEIKNRLKNLIPAPRKVPLSLKSQVMMGITGYIGAAFIILGFIFSAIFVLSSRTISAFKLSNLDKKATGIITEVGYTSVSIGGGRGRRGRPVIRYHFKFTSGSGNEYHQYSYSTGHLRGEDKKLLRRGDNVLVEYKSNNPKLSRIVGARYSVFGPFILFVLLFPFIGMVLFLSSILIGYKKIVLLKNGKIADGIIISTKMTNVRINKVPVYQYFFQYKDETGAEIVGSSKSLPKATLGDEKHEPVIYCDIRGKKYAELVDALPKHVDLNASGEFYVRGGSVSGIVISVLQVITLLCFTGLLVSIVAQLI